MSMTKLVVNVLVTSVFFYVFSPGVFFSIPQGQSQKVQTAVHALLFSVALIVFHLGGTYIVKY